MERNHTFLKRLTAALLSILLCAGSLGGLAQEETAQPEVTQKPLDIMIRVNPRENPDYAKIISEAESWVTMPSGDEIVYGAPQLRLGESDTDADYCEKIPIYEQYDSKTKLWNKNITPEILGDEYTLSVKDGVIRATTPDGEILYTGNDAGAAANAAIGHMSSEGGTLLVLEGEYPVHTTIWMKDNVRLYGENRPILSLYEPTHIIRGPENLDNTAICNFILDGRTSTAEQAGAICYEAYSTNNYFADIHARDFTSSVIVIFGTGVKNNIITRCKVTDNIWGNAISFGFGDHGLMQDCYVSRTGWGGLACSRQGGTKILDNVVVESGYYLENTAYFCHGIAIDSFGAVRSSDIWIQGNMVKDAGCAGIEVCDYQDNATVIANVVDGTGRAMPKDCYGLYFGGGLSESVKCYYAYNTVSNTHGAGISVNAPPDTPYTRQVILCNNDISNSGQDGIQIMKAHDVVIENNRIYNSGAVIKDSSGIDVKGPSDGDYNFIIRGNICTDTRKKKRQEFGLFLLNAFNVLVEDNQLGGNREDDYFELNCEFVTFRNNH